MIVTHPASTIPAIFNADFFRCAEIPYLGTEDKLAASSGYFCFGSAAVCYGHTSGETCSSVNSFLFDASLHVRNDGCSMLLPFDPTQVIDNLRYEPHVASRDRLPEKPCVKEPYYRLCRVMRIGIRRRLQSLYVQGREELKCHVGHVDRNRLTRELDSVR